MPKRKLVLFLLTVALILFILFGLIGYSSLIAFAWNLLDAYLTLVEHIADWLLQITGSEMSIVDHKVFIDGEVVYQHEKIFYKKWALALLILFWITPTFIRRKLSFSGLALLSIFIGSVMGIWLSSLLLYVASDGYSAGLMGWTPHLLLILSLMTIWIWRERKILLHALARMKINLWFLEKKLPAIFAIIFLSALVGKFLLGCFQYTPWINFLFNSTAWILRLFDFPVNVESHFLDGESGSIYLGKPCLGLNTMILFAAIIFFTGKNNLSKWLYILFGVILLNIVNIVRFVLLFIHIQKHGGYALTMNLHDIYEYVIYGIVFILWIIWFEKYSDIRKTQSG